MSRFYVVALFFCAFVLAEGEAKQLKVYRVGDLVGTVSNQEDPLGLNRTSEIVAEFHSGSEGKASFSETPNYLFSETEFLNFLDEAIQPDGGEFLSLYEHRLLASLTSKNQLRLKEILAELRESLPLFVAFNISLIELSEKRYKEFLSEGKFSSLISVEQKKELLSSENVLQTFQCSVLNNHTSMVSSGVISTYIGDYDVEVAEDSSIGDPVIFSNKDGITLALKPVVGDMDKGILVEVQGSVIETKKWEVVDLRDAKLSKIRHPEIHFQKFQSSSWIQKDQILVLGNSDKGSRLLFLIQPTIQQKASKKNQKK